MSAWEIIAEEASIVLVGNFNPAIFHPEWFIRKGIVEDWDYKKEEMVVLPDMSQFTLPGGRTVTVLLNQFTIRSSLASEYVPLKDFVTSTFSLLRETPIRQMGMNYTAQIRIPDTAKWLKFGSELAPKVHWEKAAEYIKDLDPKEQERLGLWELTMELPRPDIILGYIRPKISAISSHDRTLAFSVNNHVEIEKNSAITMVEILAEHWDESFALATNLVETMMNSQLEDK